MKKRNEVYVDKGWLDILVERSCMTDTLHKIVDSLDYNDSKDLLTYIERKKDGYKENQHD